MEGASFKNFSNLNKGLLLILIIIFSLRIGIYLSNQESAGFFIFGNLGIVKSFLHNGIYSYVEFSKFTPAYDMWLYLLHAIFGMDVVEVAFLPMGIVLVPFMYFVLARKIFNDYMLSIFLGLYMTLEIAQSGFYNTFAYAWSRSIYLAFILIAICIMKENKTFGNISTSILLFVGVTLIHYTVPVWIIIFMITIYIMSRVIGSDYYKKFSLIAIILFIIIYLSMNKIFYDVYLPQLANMTKNEVYLDTFYIFLEKLKSYLISTSISAEEYVYYPSRGFYDTGRLALNFLFFIPLIISFPIFVSKTLRKISKKSLNIDFKLYLYGAFTITIIGQAFIYGTVTGISNQYLLFMGPILAIISFDIFKKKKTQTIFLIILLLLSNVLMFHSMNDEREKLKISSVLASAKFLLNNTIENKPKVLSTISFGYYTNFIGISYNKSIYPSYFTSEIYDMLVSSRNTDLSTDLSKVVDYVIIDKGSYNNFVSSERLKYFEPFCWHSDEINNNPNLNKIYDDRNIWILKIGGQQ